jgi:ATP-binding cassette, subfamily F, member 3
MEAVAPFSGGEKARLVLALLVYQNPNLLLLDEPTNHLDLEMRHALSVALQDYQGAMVIVSHDRHLLRSVTDSLLLVANGTVQAFDGDLDDYRQWLTDQKKGEEEPAQAGNTVNVSRKDQRKQDAERRHKLKPLVDAIKRAEQTVERLHQQQFTIEQQLADPALYQENEKNRLKQLLEQKAQVDRDLSHAEEAWLTAESKLEEAQEACTSG